MDNEDMYCQGLSIIDVSEEESNQDDQKVVKALKLSKKISELRTP